MIPFNVAFKHNPPAHGCQPGVW